MAGRSYENQKDKVDPTDLQSWIAAVLLNSQNWGWRPADMEISKIIYSFITKNLDYITPLISALWGSKEKTRFLNHFQEVLFQKE